MRVAVEPAQQRRASICPHVSLVRQKNAGKAAALNTGLRHTRTELVVMVDGDTVLEPETVANLGQPFGSDAGSTSST